MEISESEVFQSKIFQKEVLRYLGYRGDEADERIVSQIALVVKRRLLR